MRCLKKMRKVYLEQTSAPYQYSVMDYETGKLLGYSDVEGRIEFNTYHKWLDPPCDVEQVGEVRGEY